MMKNTLAAFPMAAPGIAPRLTFFFLALAMGHLTHTATGRILMIMKTETHNFDLGDIVTIFNRTIGGTFVVEGKAAIVTIYKPEDLYRVRFLDDQAQGHKHTWLRYVDPNGQEDPEAYLKTLNASE